MIRIGREIQCLPYAGFFLWMYSLRQMRLILTYVRQIADTHTYKGAREEEGHVVSGNCSVYSDLRSHFGDLGEDQNLVNFFRAVLDRRDTLEEEDRTGQPLTATVVASPVPGNRDRTSQSGDLHPAD